MGSQHFFPVSFPLSKRGKREEKKYFLREGGPGKPLETPSEEEKEALPRSMEEVWRLLGVAQLNTRSKILLCHLLRVVLFS